MLLGNVLLFTGIIGEIEQGQADLLLGVAARCAILAHLLPMHGAVPVREAEFPVALPHRLKVTGVIVEEIGVRLNGWTTAPTEQIEAIMAIDAFAGDEAAA